MTRGRDPRRSSHTPEFVAAAAQLGVPAPGSTITTEIAGAAPLDVDYLERPWDPAVGQADVGGPERRR
jgi:hypothetical protein